MLKINEGKNVRKYFIKNKKRWADLYRVTDEGIVDGLGGLGRGWETEVVVGVEPDLEVGPEDEGQAGQAHQAQGEGRHHADGDQAQAGIESIN